MTGMEECLIKKCHIYIIQNQDILLQLTTKLLMIPSLITLVDCGADPSRAQQIIVRLDTMDNASVDEMKSIQLDYTSLFAKEIAPYFYSIDVEEENNKIQKSMKIFKEWDFVEDINSTGALIFHSVLRQLVIEIFGG